MSTGAPGPQDRERMGDSGPTDADGARDFGDASAATLSIGELAERTGLTPSGLRMWEHRFDFPVAQRRDGGHRRYTSHDVQQVRDVMSRRERGVRLGDAITQVRAEAAPASPSVFATLRSRHPQLEVNRMHKTTLLAISWAIEDQAVAMADLAVLWAVFQQERYVQQSSARWADIARGSGGATVMSNFAVGDATSAPRRVALPVDAPMRREWAVVVDSTDLPVALSAWELPGQDQVADRARVFETIWTLDPVAVRDAARVCAEVTRAIDPSFHHGRYATPPPLTAGHSSRPSLTRISAMVARMATYVDQLATTHTRA